jgi:hypothetical protein
VVPIPHLLADALREYLEELRPKLPESPYLFANPRGNRSLRGRRCKYRLVVAMLEWPISRWTTWMSSPRMRLVA